MGKQNQDQDENRPVDTEVIDQGDHRSQEDQSSQQEPEFHRPTPIVEQEEHEQGHIRKEVKREIHEKHVTEISTEFVGPPNNGGQHPPRVVFESHDRPVSRGPQQLHQEEAAPPNVEEMRGPQRQRNGGQGSQQGQGQGQQQGDKDHPARGPHPQPAEMKAPGNQVPEPQRTDRGRDKIPEEALLVSVLPEYGKGQNGFTMREWRNALKMRQGPEKTHLHPVALRLKKKGLIEMERHGNSDLVWRLPKKEQQSQGQTQDNGGQGDQGGQGQQNQQGQH